MFPEALLALKSIVRVAHRFGPFVKVRRPRQSVVRARQVEVAAPIVSRYVQKENLHVTRLPESHLDCFGLAARQFALPLPLIFAKEYTAGRGKIRAAITSRNSLYKR